MQNGFGYFFGAPDRLLESHFCSFRQCAKLKSLALSGQVGEWLIPTDCKSVVLWATEVRILPCPPFDQPL